MAAAPLTSNHVNYLIWRYLQESGHDRTAARLQRDWKIGNPETLPFARHIKTHALVSLVQKGLQYHELENSLSQNGERATQTPTALFFGTESAEQAQADNEASSNLKAPPSPRKHARDSLLPGPAQDAASSSSEPPASKRRRAAKPSQTAKGFDEMDVDPQPNAAGNESSNETESASRRTSGGALPNGTSGGTEQHAAGKLTTDAGSAAGATAVEPPTDGTPVASTLELGRSVPTQTDSIAELSSDATKIIELGYGKRAVKAVWNPQRPNLFASAGDGFCRIWSHPSGSGPKNAASAAAANGTSIPAIDAPATPSAPQYVDLFKTPGQTMEDAAIITAVAWSPDGDQFAVARHSDSSQGASTIALFDAEGASILDFGTGQRFYFGLTFNPSGSLLLGHGGDNIHYSDDTRDYGLRVWDVSNVEADNMTSGTSTALRQMVTGAVWADDKTIVVCGPGYIAVTAYESKSLQTLQEISPTLIPNSLGMQELLAWTFMEHDRHTGVCILAAESTGRMALLSADRQELHHVEAHSADISGIQFQPLPQHGSSGEGPRYAASASVDGSVKLWNVGNKKLELLRTLHCDSFDPARQPALAMQFSPDGAFLAVASSSKVYFWRPGRPGAWPAAEWDLEKEETGWRGGLPFIKDERETQVNGTASNGNAPSAITNGVNGHSHDDIPNTNGIASQTDATDAAAATTNHADKMSVDGDETRPAHAELDELDHPALLAWSAMGKRLAYGYGEQIAIGDFTSVGKN